MRKRIKWIALATLVIVIGGGLAVVAMRGRGAGPEVETATVERQTLRVTVSGSGDIAAIGQRDVSPQVNGTIDQLPVTDGQKVAAGQLLARINARPLRVAASQAFAAVEAARAQRDQLVRNAPQSSDIRAARAQVDQTHYAYKLARYRYRHATKYLKADKKVVMDQAFAAYLQAKANLDKLETQSALGVQLQSAEAQLDQTSRAYRKALTDLDNTEIFAPISGTLFFKASASPTGQESKVSQGTGVQAGVAIFTVANLTRTEFVADVDETDIGKVKTGQRATVELDAYYNQTFSGKVTQIGSMATTAKSGGTSFPVKIKMPRTKITLRIGMNGSADIIRESASNVLVVPYEAVYSRGGNNYVFVIEGGVAKQREISIGLSTDTLYEVTKGLELGEIVAKSKVSSLKDGQAVTVK